MTADAGHGPATPDTYVARVLGQLYPPPFRLHRPDDPPGEDSPGVDPPGVDPRDGARGSHGTGYLLLPSPRRTRIVVPADRPRAAARAVHRQLTARRARTRAARWLLTLGLGSGVVDRLSACRVAVCGPAGADSVERLLAGVLGVTTVLVTMPVGPARANRKPVLQVTDTTGAVLAFVKVGHDDLTRALVRAEGAALERLAGARFRHTRVPAVLARLDWRDLAVLVLEPLPVSGRQARGARARQALVATLREIAALSAWHGDWSANPFRSRLENELLAGGSRRAALLGALHDLDATSPAVTLGCWHGDLNPGNVAVHPDRVLVWDWERFDEGVPVGFDLLHHDLHRAITRQGADPRTAACALLESAADLLAAFDVEPRAAEATARLYLLALAARYLRDGQAAAGARLGRVEDWITPALHTPPRPH